MTTADKWISGNQAIQLTAVQFNCPWHEAEKWLEKDCLAAGRLRSRRCGIELHADSWRTRGRWYGTDLACKEPWDLTYVDLGTDWHFEIHLAELQACIRAGQKAKRQGNGPSAKIATGKRGRPTAMRLVILQHEARVSRGEAAAIPAEEGRQLAAWLQKEHPDVDPLQGKTISNKLSALARKSI